MSDQTDPEQDSQSPADASSNPQRTEQGSGKTRKRARFSVFSALQSIGVTAFLLASLFTLFTPDNLFSGQMLNRVFQAWQANPTVIAPVAVTNTPASTARIGIVSGHWKNDSGAVCPDGLTEEQVNLQIATLVQQKLIAEGFQVDLLAEFDEKLSLYQGMALISIHADTCDFISDEADGFKVAAAIHSAYPEKAARLTSCMADRYSNTTGLKYLANATTNDMTYYHAFDEITTETTAAIIETGFLNLNRQILTENPDLIAQGIVDGLLCYIRNETVTSTQPAP
jgi:N-acetylmuramoyl-L-alanine amidase